MNKFLLFTLFVFLSFHVTAQKTLTEEAIKTGLLTPYHNYFSADREMVYTQFNKSRYLTGDDIWFTCWILNPSSKLLSYSTTKLYVEIWSSDKKMISRKILNVKGGTASNFIHVADTLVPGAYCFRAYTSWMRNFYQDKDYNVPLTIVGPTVKKLKTDYTAAPKNDVLIKETLQSTPLPDYDIQLLPESGHFIEGINNVFGVKITDAYGHGVKATGKVFDGANNEIASYTTSQLGMTSFILTETQNTAYRSTIVLPDGNTREVKLPLAEKQGVAINVNSTLENVVLIQLQNNPAERALNRSYFLMIHANGVMYTNYKINFNVSPLRQFVLKKSDLGNGIIYATLFNEELKPIAERLFYNQNKTLKGKLSFQSSALSNDTVMLTVKASDSLSVVQAAKLSFSILPAGTQMNDFTSSLLSESRLRPTLRGKIENPNYYFVNSDPERLAALDNLMMIQGWRKYDWQKISQAKDSSIFAYPKENGFIINGLVKNFLKNKGESKSMITLLSPQNNIVTLSPVDNEGKFSFVNLYLKDSTKMIAIATGVKGADWNRELQTTIPETKLDTPDFKQPVGLPVKQKYTDDNPPLITKGVIQLGEVIVTARRTDPIKSPFLSVRFRNRQFEFTKENYHDYHTLDHLLKVNFGVVVKYDEIGQEHFMSIFDDKSVFSTTSIDPIMVIDGMQVKGANELLSVPKEMIDAVAVEYGLYHILVCIIITTRTTPLFEKADDTNINRLLVKGYAAPKEYFEPKYLFTPENPEYSKYATLYWKPDVITDTTGATSFKFVVPHSISTVNIRAEGINLEGLIYLHDQKLILPGREYNEF